MRLKVRFPTISTRSRIMQRLLRIIERLNHRHAAGFIAISFGLGQVINRYRPLDKFLIYQLLFIPAVVIAFMEIKRFVMGVEKYRMMTASHPNRGVGDYISNLLESCWAIPGLVVISSLYIYSTISLKYIKMNLAGYYALLMIALVMLSAILGQTCYVYYLLLLWKISRSKKFKYNFYFPARTDWVQLIAQIGTRLSNAFFVLGFIYTTVYSLNVPSGYIRMSFRPRHAQLSTPNDLVFLVSWLTIFIIIIFAFPMYAWLKSKYLRAIIGRLKEISISEIEMLMMKSNLRDKGDVDTELKSYQLMVNIENSSSSLSEKYNILPVAATLSSMAVHLIKISESFLQ